MMAFDYTLFPPASVYLGMYGMPNLRFALLPLGWGNGEFDCTIDGPPPLDDCWPLPSPLPHVSRRSSGRPCQRPGQNRQVLGCFPCTGQVGRMCGVDLHVWGRRDDGCEGPRVMRTSEGYEDGGGSSQLHIANCVPCELRPGTQIVHGVPYPSTFPSPPRPQAPHSGIPSRLDRPWRCTAPPWAVQSCPSASWLQRWEGKTK